MKTYKRLRLLGLPKSYRNLEGGRGVHRKPFQYFFYLRLFFDYLVEEGKMKNRNIF